MCCQAQQVELRLSQQQEAEPEVKTGAPAQEAAERTSSQLEVLCAAYQLLSTIAASW